MLTEKTGEQLDIGEDIENLFNKLIARAKHLLEKFEHNNKSDYYYSRK